MPRKTQPDIGDPKLGLQWRIRTIPSIASMVEEDNYQQFSISIMDLQEGASTTANIDISSISAVMQRSRSGGAFATGTITQPTFVDTTAGRVYCSYRFLAAEWQVGDMYRLTVSGITVDLTSSETAYLPAEVWSNMVVEHAELAADVNNIVTYLTSPASGLGAIIATLSYIITKLDAPAGLGGIMATLSAFYDMFVDPATGFEAIQNTVAAVYGLTDSLEATLGAVNTAAHTGAVDDVTTAMGYLKQLVTDLRTVDGNVDSILEDTGTTIPASITLIKSTIDPSKRVHCWVDSGGDNANTGLDPSDPVETYTYALANLVTAGRYDVIHGMANSPSSPPANEEFPISVNKNGVTIRGEHGKGLLSDSGIGSDEQDVATFDIAAQYVTIEDMYIGCDQLHTIGGLITIGISSWAFTLRRCLLDSQYLPAYGIYTAQSQNYMLIEDCIFGRKDIAGYTNACIDLPHSIACVLRRNLFNVTGVGIRLSGGACSVSVLDNKFWLPSDTKGKAITVTSGSGKFFFDGNVANYGKTTMTNNPYLDEGSAANTWGLNYKGAVSVMPATS